MWITFRSESRLGTPDLDAFVCIYIHFYMGSKILKITYCSFYVALWRTILSFVHGTWQLKIKHKSPNEVVL